MFTVYFSLGFDKISDFPPTLLAMPFRVAIVDLPLFNSSIYKSTLFSVLSMPHCYSYTIFLLDDLSSISYHL